MDDKKPIKNSKWKKSIICFWVPQKSKKFDFFTKKSTRPGKKWCYTCMYGCMGIQPKLNSLKKGLKICMRQKEIAVVLYFCILLFNHCTKKLHTKKMQRENVITRWDFLLLVKEKKNN